MTLTPNATSPRGGSRVDRRGEILEATGGND